jgi:hypothetical protein
MSQDDVFLLGISWDFLEDSTVLLRSVLAAAGGALILAVGLCSPALATTPEMPDGQQPPAVEQVEPETGGAGEKARLRHQRNRLQAERRAAGL